MMIPQVASRLINEHLTAEHRVILDPYCGSGTSLVEANLSGRSAIGIDINPLARMIAEAKTTPIESLDRHLDQFLRRLGDTPPMVCTRPLDYWFPPEVLPVLETIRSVIDHVTDDKVKLFLTIAFSEVIRDVSYVNKGGYKRHRMKELSDFHPEPLKLLRDRIERNTKGLSAFMERTREYAISTRIFDFNTIETVEPLKGEPIDAIITSPPYGDSRTTVAYGEFSSFSLEWLGIDARGLDNTLMGGGKRHRDYSRFPTILSSLIDVIAAEDAKRANDVATFYADYQSSIDKVASLLRPGSIAAYVVGNRIVKNQKLPTDEITRHFFEQNAFDHVETIVRTIPAKRMPRTNCPSNKAGEEVSTMNEEYIVIMRKTA